MEYYKGSKGKKGTSMQLYLLLYWLVLIFGKNWIIYWRNSQMILAYFVKIYLPSYEETTAVAGLKSFLIYYKCLDIGKRPMFAS